MGRECKIIVDVSPSTRHLKMRGAKPKKSAAKKNGKKVSVLFRVTVLPGNPSLICKFFQYFVHNFVFWFKFSWIFGKFVQTLL